MRESNYRREKWNIMTEYFQTVNDKHYVVALYLDME